MENKKGQVAIFIILAIVIVGGVIAYFSLKGNFLAPDVPADLKPAYDYYLSCLEATTEEGIVLLGEQGGRIDVGEFFPGSAYMPFSSHLDFLGQGVPYWMYVSGNNLLKENVPTKGEMERELAGYVEERLFDCDFGDFELAGYDVYVEKGSVVAKINEMDVEVDVLSKVTIFRGESSAVVEGHEFKVSSKLGRFYDLAMDVYEYERGSMFLEKYAIDVMRLYAPVDGVEMSCAPKIFVDEEIREDIVSGLAANIPTLKLEGDYYDLSGQEREYFVIDAGLDVGENVNFMYSPDWPTRVEIYGDKVVKPVGTQQGLSILGFCYVPYHLIYDINFPVMVQFYDDEELFQFPLAVVISKNQAREALPTVAGRNIESKVCEFLNQKVDVYTYDVNLESVEARISFKCLDSVCNIGESVADGSDAVLKGEFPQCVNGFIIADAEGYAQAKYQISTNEERIANIVLDKEYELGLDLGDVDRALVNFVSDDYSATVMYPEIKDVTLIEGEYEISVYVYENSSLNIEGYSERMCVDVPAEGVGGFIGMEEEKCYDVNVPSMDVEMAVVGGGKSVEYIAESMLSDSVELNLNVPLFGKPSSLDELQENYVKVEESMVFLEFE
jgi:hypothetical protein